MLAGLLMAGLGRTAMAVESASPAIATEANCHQSLVAVDEGIRSRMPADPDVAQVILNLRREGNELCRKDASQEGLIKLQQATALLESGVLSNAKTKP